MSEVSRCEWHKGAFDSCRPKFAVANNVSLYEHKYKKQPGIQSMDVGLLCVSDSTYRGRFA